LRLTRSEIDLDELLRVMTDLYEPVMSERGIKILLRSGGAVKISADAALVHRMVANLFDNELKHLPASCTVTIRLFAEPAAAFLILEDDGPGFDSEISAHMFERRVKGRGSNGRGLGLAFVEAVVRTHGGEVVASNRPEGGAALSIRLPRVAELHTEVSPSPVSVVG
jgi:signal transduction histidine kinase